MPATKIETGVLLDLKRLVLSPHARKHNPEKIASLAQSLKDHNQQLEDLIVCPQEEDNCEASSVAREASQTGDTLHEQRFTVLAGVGRKQAEESLGWTKARCTILYGLTPYEKLKVTLDENKEREEEGPLDEARLYRAMKEAEPDLSQEALAKRLGMEQGTLSQYLSLTKLDSKVQDVIDRSINLGFAHLLQICRLNTPEDAKQASDRCVSDQISLAMEADQQELSVKELKALVDQKLGNNSKKAKSSISNLNSKIQNDPLTHLWEQVKVSPDCPQSAWKVSYAGKGTWHLAITIPGDSPEQGMKAWFQKFTWAMLGRKARQLFGEARQEAAAGQDANQQELEKRTAWIENTGAISPEQAARLAAEAQMGQAECDAKNAAAQKEADERIRREDDPEAMAAYFAKQLAKQEK